jgi:ribosomal-protein-alanine N-acetyltransferase
MTYLLRKLHNSDITSVSEIEREAFPSLWPRSAFKSEVDNPKIKHLVAAVIPPENTVEEVAEESVPGRMPQRLIRNLREILRRSSPEPSTQDYPVGYVSTWLVFEEAHITAIAVREAYRGLGIGELLLAGAIETAMHEKSRVVTLEVRVSNNSAIALYKKYGFKKVGLRKAYYSDNREDADIMTTDPIMSLAYQRRFMELRHAYLKRYGPLGLPKTFARV